MVVGCRHREMDVGFWQVHQVLTLVILSLEAGHERMEFAALVVWATECGS